MQTSSCKNCVLANLCLPFALEQQQLEKLDKYINQQRKVKRGESLYRKDDSFKSLYAVRSGAFKAALDQNEREQITGFFLPGEMLGFDGIHGKQYTSNVIALSDSSVCEVGYNDLLQLSQQIPKLQQQVFSMMSQEIVTDMHANLHSTAEIKLLHFLLQLSERFSRRGLSEARFELPMSRQDIANYLGLANETISRLFTKLQDDKLIILDKREINLLAIDDIRNEVHSH